MDWAFVAGLAADPEPLWACDDATFEARPRGGGFEVANADSGEFLYELGLRNGDEIMSLNRLPLANHDDVGFAYGSLWGETSFVLEVRRGASVIELNYSLLVTL